jgi:hypothetical protein
MLHIYIYIYFTLLNYLSFASFLHSIIKKSFLSKRAERLWQLFRDDTGTVRLDSLTLNEIVTFSSLLLVL